MAPSVKASREIQQRTGILAPCGQRGKRCMTIAGVDAFRCHSAKVLEHVCSLVETGQPGVPVCSRECEGFVELGLPIEASDRKDIQKPRPPATDYLACPHRGEETGESLDCNCSFDKKVFECARFGKCVKRLPVGKTLDDFDLAGAGVCNECNAWRQSQRHFYRSIADVWRDARAWSLQLPENILGFCGVHRSGIGVAQALACHRNVHYVDFDSMRLHVRTWEEQIRRRFGSPVEKQGFILVVDDTVWSGHTMREKIKTALAHCTIPHKFGALYWGRAGRGEIDFGFEQTPHVWQTFESNIFQDAFVTQQSFDLDGVLCPDVPDSETDNDEDRYLDWFARAKPLVKPIPTMGAIITARLEKYRPQTEAWLDRHGIRFDKLIMLPGYETNAVRNLSPGVASRFKAEQYSKLVRSTLFVESDDRQAEEIARQTGKSVLAWPSQRRWNCD